jgi:archaellum biogenesis ATPase FlaH
MLDFLDSLPDDVSSINVIEEHRLLKLATVSTELATRLATGQHDDTTERLLDRYHRLQEGLDDDDIQWRLEPDDFEEDSAARIPVWPRSLNRYIGGGVLRGHNITVYGRPDSGKSMWALNQAASSVRKGYKVLYVANEEPAQDITRRLLSRLTGVELRELRDPADIRRAIDHVREDYDRWFLFHKAGATAADIKRIAAKVKPDVIIVDQLKNVSVDDDNRALQLDKLARCVRELGIATNAVTISVTQAGESGQDKLVLDMGDIEWSNTGIPGAADMLLGIGVNDEYNKKQQRMLSIPKNKVNGRHGAFPVWVEPTQTAFLSSKER